MLGGTNVSPKDELDSANCIVHLTLMSRVDPFFVTLDVHKLLWAQPLCTRMSKR
jgi:hypothetical protein